MSLVKTARALRARILRAITLAVNHFVAQITRLRASHLLNQTESTQSLSRVSALSPLFYCVSSGPARPFPLPVASRAQPCLECYISSFCPLTWFRWRRVPCVLWPRLSQDSRAAEGRATICRPKILQKRLLHEVKSDPKYLSLIMCLLDSEELKSCELS